MVRHYGFRRLDQLSHPGEEARRRRAIEETVVGVFEGWDYEEIIPPLYDYADVFGGQALASRTYSFVGRDGSLLALRADFTSLLAKIVAGRLAQRPLPLRLYYSGEVLRYEPPKAGRQTELHQMGVENLGAGRRVADVEMLGIAAECLERLGAEGWVLALGHVGVFTGLLQGLDHDVLEPGTVERLRERIDAKDRQGVAALLSASGVPAGAADPLVRLTTLAGDAGVLSDPRAWSDFTPAARAAMEELRQIVGALAAAGLGSHVTVDLSEVKGLDYYTGLVFRAYGRGLGFELGGGGRYDSLLSRFHRPMPAVGFVFGLDRLDLLLQRQKAPGASAPPALVSVEGGTLGEQLAQARRLRAGDTRVRLGRDAAHGAAPGDESDATD
jgi:ATP phosphoribosyltransferase regulatory subunit